MLLITFGNNQTEIINSEKKPTALLGIGFVLVGPNVLLLLKSTWKFIFKSAAMPSKKTVFWVSSQEFLMNRCIVAEKLIVMAVTFLTLI